MAPFKRTTLPAHLKPEHAGRPTDYRPEYAELVIEAMAEGISLTAFAGMIRVAPKTVYEWIKAHSEFSNAVARARGCRVLWLERKLLRSRKGAETTAAIFALKNACPDEWRDVKYQEHKYTLGIEKLTREQLNAIAAGVSPSDAGVIEGEAQRLNER